MTTITVRGSGGLEFEVDDELEYVQKQLASSDLVIVGEAYQAKAKPLAALKKDVLVAMAEELGLEVDETATKAEIMAAIEEAQGGDD